jgi:hypothetical protein
VKRTKPAIFQLKVTLRESSPLIWRRIEISPHMTLPQLHRTLQIVVGWENCHLHEFRSAGKVYAEPDPEDRHFGREVLDERRRKIGLLVGAGASFEYLYEFGDGWRHEITLETMLAPTPRKRYPVCVDGARSAPPEDVGGMGGYERYLEALSDPRHKEHQFLLAWRGRFDPEYFSIAKVNRRLREEFQLPGRRIQRRDVALFPEAGPASATFEEEFDSILNSLVRSGRLPQKKPSTD